MAATPVALILILLLAGCTAEQVALMRAGHMCQRFLSRDLHLFDSNMEEGHRLLASRAFEGAIASYTKAYEVAESGKRACEGGKVESPSGRWTRNFHFWVSRALRSLGDAHLRRRRAESTESDNRNQQADRERFQVHGLPLVVIREKCLLVKEKWPIVSTANERL